MDAGNSRCESSKLLLKFIVYKDMKKRKFDIFNFGDIFSTQFDDYLMRKEVPYTCVFLLKMVSTAFWIWNWVGSSNRNTSKTINPTNIRKIESMEDDPWKGRKYYEKYKIQNNRKQNIRKVEWMERKSRKGENDMKNTRSKHLKTKLSAEFTWNRQ